MENAYLEKAARRLYEIKCVDPEKLLTHDDPDGVPVVSHSPAWELEVNAIKEYLQIEQAVSEIRLEMLETSKKKEVTNESLSISGY